MRRRVFILLAVLATAGGLAAWRALREPAAPTVLKAWGSIEVTQVYVASKVPGRIAELLVAEGATVTAGQIVARLDAAEVEAALAQARATVEAATARLAQAEEALRAQRNQAGAAVAQAEAQVEAARARVPQAEIAQDWQARQVTEQVAQARAQVAAAERAADAARANIAALDATLARAMQDLQRVEALFRDGAVAAQQVDAAQAQVRVLRAQREGAVAQEAAAARGVRQAEALLRAAEGNRLQVKIRQQDVAVAEAQVRQAQAGLRAARVAFDLVRQREQDVAAGRAQLAQAQAALDLVRAQAENTILRAPVGGTVVTKSVEVGDVVPAGQRLIAVARLDPAWIRVYIPESDLPRVRLGQPARVFVDGFPGRAYEGTVTEIGQQAEFTPRSAQTREERVKLVFAVKITLPNPDLSLKSGMPADAEILLPGGGQDAR
jgi:HlyD family secretion protein